jgi:tetratricopeptide (TPR) repeat protein
MFMVAIKKPQKVLAAALVLWIAAGVAFAQTSDTSTRLEELFVELAKPGRDDWQRIEGEIVRIWSQSGSDAMDMLLQRGNDAMARQDLKSAVGHYSALIDHAPDFAEGWNARATAYYHMGEYALSVSDIERVLALNPRHFGALWGLASILEEMGEIELSLEALRAVRALTPNRRNVDDTIKRLERATGGAEL